MFIYFQPLYLQQLGADPVEIGAILGAAGLAMAVAHMPAGALADAFGRKGVMVISWVFGMVAAWMMFLAGGLGLFVAGLLLYSLTAFVMSPLASYVTEARGSWSVARALTTTSAFFNLGVAAGPLIGGALAERFGLREVYGVAAALFLPSAILVLLIRSQPTEHHEGDSRYRDLLRRREFLGLLVLAFAVMFGLYLSWPLTPNYLHGVRQVSLGQIGILGSFNALGVVALNLTLGRTNPRLGYMLCQVGIGVSVALLWLAIGVPWLAFGYLLAGGMRRARSMVTAQVDGIVHRAEMGLAYGMAETAQAAALVLAPILAGLLYRVDPALPYPTGLVLIGLMMVVTLRFAPRPVEALKPPSSPAPPSGLQPFRREMQ
jgi:MFS family permease